MKLRKLKKLTQEKHGYWDTKSWRTETSDYDWFTCEPLKVCYVRCSVGRGQHPWRKM